MSKNINLNKGQINATRKIIEWWNEDIGEVNNYFSVTGSAGTGKSTLVREVISQLGLTDYEVVYVAYTGKASMVLNMKGLRATTIHKLIYEPYEVKEPLYDKDNNPILDKKGEPKYKRKIKFRLKDFLDDSIKLIVIDEASMINEKIWLDLNKFNKRILLLSDHKQLPPIVGECIKPVRDPDFTLTEIMRQSMDSDIVKSALDTINGDIFEILNNQFQDVYSYPHGDVHIISPTKLTDKMLTKSDIILCGKNKTRSIINSYMRDILGFHSDIPKKDDKMICRKNDWDTYITHDNSDIYIINGLIGYVNDLVYLDTLKNGTVEIDFRPDFIKPEYDKYFSNLPISLDFLKGKSRDEISDDGYLFEYAYAITTHLSQGSEWDRIIIFYERMGDMEFMKKWLYTAITRAKKKVIIVKGCGRYFE